MINIHVTLELIFWLYWMCSVFVLNGVPFCVSEMTLKVNPPDQQDLQKAQPCCEFHKQYIIKTCHQTYSSLELRTPFWGFQNFTFIQKSDFHYNPLCHRNEGVKTVELKGDFKNNAMILKIQKVPREERISKKKKLFKNAFSAWLFLCSSDYTRVLL